MYVIETSVKGKSIANYDIQTKERREISKPSFDDISRLQVNGSKLYFLKDVKGKYVIGGRKGGMPEMTFEYTLKEIEQKILHAK